MQRFLDAPFCHLSWVSTVINASKFSEMLSFNRLNIRGLVKALEMFIFVSNVKDIHGNKYSILSVGLSHSWMTKCWERASSTYLEAFFYINH